jgi:N-acetyl-alpha-D-muramate 1-phosphate uridylyltransferase
MSSRALIFAAGKGERMRPLTLHTPKPLLDVGGKPLIVWHIEKLAALGITDIVINTSWLAERFPEVLGDGSRWNVRLHFSYEGAEPLETGGGMLKALPLLGDAPFIAVNGDIWTDYDFALLPNVPLGRAHAVLIAMPAFRKPGEFEKVASRLLLDRGDQLFTFSGIAVYRPEFIAHHAPGRFSLVHDLIECARSGQLSAERLHGQWHDVGTPERLAELDALLRG